MQDFLIEWATGDAGFQFRAVSTRIDPPLSIHARHFRTSRSAKRFEPLTSATILLVHRHVDREKVILELADRRLGYHSNEDKLDTVALYRWPPTTRPSVTSKPELWEDWMWEVSTWFGKMGPYDSTPLRPITDVPQGLALKYIPGVSMEKPKPDIDVSDQGAKKISNDMMAGLRAVKVENCLLHNDTRNVVLREGNRSPVIIDFGEANIRQPGANDDDWTTVRIRVTCGDIW
ncbi:uncharacterized protein ARMOST_15962 [Armillaria ostoyae]|uniref:Uncharacterized protein n=1 Tax=Armillaria ostoyae TaxID=47428 RepID=A0A284RUT2_ARMOS|nr:uncharacterized protein ARMOST_15962 [Armillaria ostoyae]